MADFDLAADEIIQIIKRMPKLETHVHDGGSIAPDMARKLADRHREDLREIAVRLAKEGFLKKTLTDADQLFTPDGKAYAALPFVDLVTWGYDTVNYNVRTKKDYTDIVYDYQRQAAGYNSIYTGFIISPDHAMRQGLSYKDMVDGVVAGVDHARKDFDIEARLRPTFVRHLSDKELQATADAIISYPHPYIRELDIAGLEIEGVVLKFKPYVDQVLREMPYLLLDIHAGENAGPQNVWDALEMGAEGIGHGVRSIEDPELVQELVRRGTVLDIAIGSNITAGIYKRYEDHSVRQLFDAGVKMTLNTDDPPLFNCNIGGQYELAHKQFGFTVGELSKINYDGVERLKGSPDLQFRLRRKLKLWGQDINRQYGFPIVPPGGNRGACVPSA